MYKKFFTLAVAMIVSVNAFSATYNTGNAPTFLWLDICTNGMGDEVSNSPVPRMEPGVFDIGLDFGADGTVDRWLSQETAAYLGQGNADVIQIGNWRRHYIRLDDAVGQQAKVVIIDNSSDYYIAVNAVRLNHADGIVVENPINNGYFDDGLTGWTVVNSSIPEANLIVQNDGFFTDYGTSFFATGNGAGESGNTATVESNVFTITQPSSFIYGSVSGGASAMWYHPDSPAFDPSGVFIDIADSAAGLNGTFDEDTDIPVIGFTVGTVDSVRNQVHPVFFNTSGLEGKFAQVVAIDNSEFYHIGLDSFRMNWDHSIIENGGFDQLPVVEEGQPLPDPIWWMEDSAVEYVEHPDAIPPSGNNPGTFPGWRVFAPSDGLDSVWFWDKACHGNMFSGRSYIGTSGFDDGGRISTGITIMSNPFTITPVPNPSNSVFLQFNSAQGSARHRYTANAGNPFPKEEGVVELQIDTNGNGSFDDAGDVKYREIDQNMGHNYNNSNMDVWHYPEYRIYIPSEYQGMDARIFVKDTLGPTRGSYGWMCVDDFFVWNGSEAVLPFPNSDFEMGSLENWETEYDINGGGLSGSISGWLSGTLASLEAGIVDHLSMNNRHSSVDGAFSADSAADEAGIGGDGGTGTLISTTFSLPSVGSSVNDWSIFE